MIEPAVHSGFCYSKAVLRLARVYTYRQIAAFCGYESEVGIYKVVRGSIPSHPAGEAIYIMYVERFKEKPE